MIHLIALILISSLFIFGIHYAMDFDLDETKKPVNKEVLWFLKYYAKWLLFKTKFSWLLKPLCDCPVCMSSIWGSVIYWSMTPEINQTTITQWLAAVGGTAGLNRIISSILQK